MRGNPGGKGAQSHPVKEASSSAMGEYRVLDEGVDGAEDDKGRFAPGVRGILAALDEVPRCGPGACFATGGCFFSHDAAGACYCGRDRDGVVGDQIGERRLCVCGVPLHHISSQHPHSSGDKDRAYKSSSRCRVRINNLQEAGKLD